MMYVLYSFNRREVLRERREICFERNQGLSPDAQRQHIADRLPGGQKQLEETRRIETMRGIPGAAQEYAWRGSSRWNTYFKAVDRLEERGVDYDPGAYLQEMRKQMESQRQLLNPSEASAVTQYRPTPIIIIHPPESEEARRISPDRMHWMREIARVRTTYVEREQFLRTTIQALPPNDHKMPSLLEGFRQLVQGKDQMALQWHDAKNALPPTLTPQERNRALCQIDAGFVKAMDVFLAPFDSIISVLKRAKYGPYDDGHNPATVIIR